MIYSNSAPNEQKRIWISGGSSGIGAALSLYYSKSGTVLGITGKNPTALGQTAQRCRDLGATVYQYTSDVRDRAETARHANDFLNKAGGIDIVVANAGIRIEERQDYSDWESANEIMQVNYVGAINTLVPFIAEMKKQKHGRLAIMSSISALRGTPNSGAYSASKAAINIWAESLRQRLKPFDISVTVICMGFVATAMTEGLPFKMPGLLQPEKAAALTAESIARKRRVVVHPWQSKLIWRGFQMMPGFLYDIVILAAKSRHPNNTVS
jgi:short-subunit dehydrogenase